MPQRRRSLGDLAESVLAHVAQEQAVKTATLSKLASVTVQSELGDLLVKTAERIRDEAARTEISYADLETFRKTYDL